MKFATLVLAMLMCGVGATAQNPYIALQGVVDQGGSPVLSQPQSRLLVNVLIERDVILAGPYARYAQKFLGVRAPLTDKTIYAFKSASVTLDNSTLQIAEATDSNLPVVVSHSIANEEFARIQPDKVSMVVAPLEDAAREAATTIFSLRKHRLELITGEAGENVFGEGLSAALSEISRLEQEYLELFMGKRVLTPISRQYFVFPKSDKRQYVVCRFSAANGLLPDSDLSGDMVVLQVEPTGDAASPTLASPKESATVACRIANLSVCTLICGTKEFARATLPIFELGRTVNLSVARRK